MKKTILMILAVLLLLSPYQISGGKQYKYYEIEPGITRSEEVRELYQEELTDNYLTPYTVVKDSDNTVVIFCNMEYRGYVEKILVFSPERECIYSASCDINSNVEPIKLEEDSESLIGIQLDDIVEKYGPFHFLDGSGLTRFCYILEDGCCIFFTVESSTDASFPPISSVVKIDELDDSKLIEKIGF